MKVAIPKPKRVGGFTRTDLLVVLLTGGLLICLAFPILTRPKTQASRIRCISNLKQIGLSFRIWGNEHDDRYPYYFPGLTNEHTGIPITGNTTNAMAWMHFQVLSNEILDARIIACPEDELRWENTAEEFGNNALSLSHPTKRDLAVSYFVGLFADETRPDTILAGDRNLAAEAYRKPFGTEAGGGAVQLPGRYALSIAPGHTLHQTRVIVAFADGSVSELPLEGFKEKLIQSVQAYGTNANLFLFPQ